MELSTGLSLHKPIYTGAMSKTMKKHIVYETANIINGRKYIGKHSTNNINDNYLGSGKALKFAIKKYGKDNFERKILAIFDTEEESFELEKRLITEDITSGEIYYNMANGGKGGYNEGTKKLWEDKDFRDMRTRQVKEQWKDPKLKEMLSKKAKNEWKDPEYRKIRSDSMKKKWSDPEYRKMKSETNRGENSARSKLKELDVIEIKKKLKLGIKVSIINKEYNVSRGCIDNIKYNRTWKHVEV